MQINVRNKGTLYWLIFSKKKNLLSLYNALNDSHYTNVKKLAIEILTDNIYLKYENDHPYLVFSDLSLIEENGFVCPNLSIISFCDVGEHDAEYVNNDLDDFQIPKSYAFYNSVKEMEEKSSQKISYYCEETGETVFEWVTTIYDLSKGKNKEFVDKCKPLKEYIFFVTKLREYKENELSDAEAIDKVIDLCLKNNMLMDFLEENEDKVRKTCLAELERHKYENELKNDAREEGIKEMILSMYKNGIEIEKIASITNKEISYIKEIIQQ